MGTLSTVLIGDAAVTLQCGQRLFAGGHRLLGVATGDGRVAGWAAGAGIPCCFLAAQEPICREDVLALVAGQPFDLLLSVHNLRRFPPDLLALPQRMAVNFHDAPLPRYAGLNAPSWAIVRGELQHGIVWHRMAPEFDTGEILVERRLAIEAGETAWSLGIRCTEAALAGFSELLSRLSNGTLAPRPQDLSARTFFSGWRRPAAGCVVPWDEPAENISAFVRGLDFGASDNPMGIPKVVGAKETLWVRQVVILETISAAPPGTLVRAEGEGLAVATATLDVRISALADLDGKPLAPDAALARLGLRLGERFSPTAPCSELLVARERGCHHHEAHWLRTFARLLPLAPPEFGLPRSGVPPVGAEVDAGADVAIEADLPESAPIDDDTLLAAILASLGEEIGQPFDVAFGEPHLRSEIAARGWQGFLVARPPIRVPWREGVGLREQTHQFREERARLREHGTYTTDLPLRGRRLAATHSHSGDPFGSAMSLDLLTEGERLPARPPGGSIRLELAVDPFRRRLWLRCDRSCPHENLLRLSQRLLGRLGSRPQPEAASRKNRAHRSATVGERFLDHAAQTPNATAVECGDERWSYERLEQRSGRLAAALTRRGVGVESLVALRLARLPDLVTAMLAVHRAGAAFLVLDALETPDRIGRILAETRPHLALTDSGALRLPAQLPVHPIDLADGRELSPLRISSSSRPSSSDRDLAYVATTSGSTGAPKGVAIEQGALGRYIAAAGLEFELSPADRILQLGSPAFDLALEQIFGALCHGSTLVGLDSPSLPTPRELMAFCSERAISVLDLPTAVWEQTAPEIAARGWTMPSELRLLVLGGELASARAARVWLESSRGRSLINTYGPTEATIVATWWKAPRRAADLVGETGLPIGRPIPGALAAVLDSRRRPVAPGEAGELWLGGGGVARGYHLRPDLTAAQFAFLDLPRASPTGDIGGPGAGRERYYATGDRVLQRADGELEFLGRLDRQVKIAGRRVEPGEVEATLRAIRGVTAAAVAPAREGAGGLRLRGWVVLEATADLVSVAAECERRLPAFLRPSPIVAVTALPLTLAGKVDFERLLSASAAAPTATTDALTGAQSDAPPADEVERRLASIWARLLGGNGSLAFTRDGNFFALGGDSLAAVSLLVEIEASFGVPLRVAALLRSPTLSLLAAELRACLAENSLPSLAPSLVTLVRPTSTTARAPAIYCVHGLGGHLLRLVSLAHSLSPQRVLVGLQSPGLDDHRPIPRTIEELALTFLREVRSQPLPPPYRIAGMSFGGLVAYEMARLCEPDEFLWVAMFDTELAEVVPGFRPPPPSPQARLRARLRRFGGDRLGHLRRLRRRLREGRDEALKANEYRHFSRVMRANDAAMALYRPGAWAGKVTFLAATPRPLGLYEEFMRATGCELRVVPVPGDHLSMLDPPHVATLAAELDNLF